MRWRVLRLPVIGMLVVLAPLQAFAMLLGGAPLAAAAQPAVEVHKVDEAHFTDHPDQPLFVLAVGNDARTGQTISRGDALHVIGINPAQGKATMLDIPRDTYVPIPGHGSDKINTSHVYGGPALQAQVVGDLVGVHISYVIDTDFDGFIAMVDELGGVDIDVPYPMSDSFSGAFFQPGRQHMDGHQALAFSRDRHLGYGDITRSLDQGLMILAAMAKLKADASSPAVLRDLAVLGRHCKFVGIGPRELYHLGRLALSIDPANVRNVVMPWSLGQVGPASVVFVGGGAGSLFDDFRDDAVLETH